MRRRPARPETEGHETAALARTQADGIQEDRPASSQPRISRAGRGPRHSGLGLGERAQRPASCRRGRERVDVRDDIHGCPPGDDDERRCADRVHRRTSSEYRVAHAADRLEPDQARQQHTRVPRTDPGALLQSRRLIRAEELQLVSGIADVCGWSRHRLQERRSGDARRFAQRRLYVGEHVHPRSFGDDDVGGRHRRRLLRHQFEQDDPTAVRNDRGIRRRLRGPALESRRRRCGVHPGNSGSHRRHEGADGRPPEERSGPAPGTAGRRTPTAPAASSPAASAAPKQLQVLLQQ